MRKLIAAVCLVAVALLPACSKNKPPNSLFDGAGYHVRADKVYWLRGFPDTAREVTGVDVASFEAFNSTYARDKSTVYFDGQPIPDADAASFELLDRSGFFKDGRHVYQLDQPFGNLSKDSVAVYWSDGRVLSDDPTSFAIIATKDHYLNTKDSRTVHVNGDPIPGADPATYRVLQGGYAQDARRIFYFTDQIADADLVSFHAVEGPDPTRPRIRLRTWPYLYQTVLPLSIETAVTALDSVVPDGATPPGGGAYRSRVSDSVGRQRGTRSTGGGRRAAVHL